MYGFQNTRINDVCSRISWDRSEWSFLLAAGAQFSFIELPIESLYCLYCSIVHSLQTCDRVSYSDDRNRLRGNNRRSGNAERAFMASLNDASFLLHWLILPSRNTQESSDQEIRPSWTNNKHFLQPHWSTLPGLFSLLTPWTPSPPREGNRPQMWITAASWLSSCTADVSAREDNHAGRLRKQQEGWQIKSQKHWHPGSFGCTQEHFHTHTLACQKRTGEWRDHPFLQSFGWYKTHFGSDGSGFLSAKSGASLDDDEHGGWFRPWKLWPSVKEMRGNLLKVIQSAGSINLIFAC